MTDIFLRKQLIVSATPTGMQESRDFLPVPLEFVKETRFIYDLIYAPLETVPVKEVRDRAVRAGR